MCQGFPPTPADATGGGASGGSGRGCGALLCMPRTSTRTPPFDRRRRNVFSSQLRPSRWSMTTGCPASAAHWSMYRAVCSTPLSKASGGGCFTSARFELRYRHRRQVGGLVIRDDRVVQHAALLDYEWPRRRLMHRVTAGGSVPC